MQFQKFTDSILYSLPRILFLVVSCLLVVHSNANFLASFAEKGAYEIIRQALIENGKTHEEATCIVKFMKATGATDDVTSLIFDPKAMVQELQNRIDFANFACSGAGILTFFIAIIVLVWICCCCVRCCLTSSKQPLVIQLANREFPTANIPYNYVDKV
jgi:hypothetical protein